MARQCPSCYLSISVCLISLGLGITGEVLTNSGCYGSLERGHLTSSCEQSEGMLAVKQVWVGAKPKNLSCPSEESGTNTAGLGCCTQAEGDCIFVYNGNATDSYFNDCNGKPTCVVPISHADTARAPCNATEFLQQTNFMFSEYICASSATLVRVPHSVSKSGKTVYLANRDFPGNGSADGECSVSVNCVTPLSVTRLDLRSGCPSIRISNQNGSNVELNCQNVSRGVFPVSAPLGSFLRVTIHNSGAQMGQFWLQFEAEDARATLRVGCGSEKEQPPVDMPPCDKLEETGTPYTSTPDGTTGRLSTAAIVAIVVGIVFVVALVSIGVLVAKGKLPCCRREKTGTFY